MSVRFNTPETVFINSFEAAAKVTFKGSDNMVYLVSWIKDGQNHSLDFYRPVTRDVAKAIIRNIVEETLHTK